MHFLFKYLDVNDAKEQSTSTNKIRCNLLHSFNVALNDSNKKYVR